MLKSVPVLAILGPTASGKTDLAIQLYEQGIAGYPIQIISVDSVMVYRGFNIGTGKPDPSVLQRIKHELVDCCEPNDIYSVAQFCADAKSAINRAILDQKIPVLVGGTMLYFKALQNGLSKLPSADPEIRSRLFARGQVLGWPALHAELTQIDPVAAQQIQPQDQQRIQRGLEVYEQTGQKLSDYWSKNNLSEPVLNQHEYYNILITPDRTELHEVIAQRFFKMIAAGWIEEAENLLNQYPNLTALHPAYRAVGYRQIFAYLKSECSKTDMIEKSIIATRQLAKRQYTWLKSFQANQDQNANQILNNLNKADLKNFTRLLHVSGFLDKVIAYMY